MSFNEFLRAQGARLSDGIITDFGDWVGEYEAVHSGGIVASLGARDHLRITGSQAFSFLNRLLTYAIDDLPIRMGCRPFLLDARGRIEGCFYGYRVGPDELWVDTVADAGEALANRLDMFHFGEDFQISGDDWTMEHFVAVGPKLPELLGSIGLDIPTEAWMFSYNPKHDVHVGRIPRFHQDCWDILVSKDGATDMWDMLCQAGLRPSGTTALEALRIESILPAAPNEFSPAVTPLDAQGKDGITDGKGCYPGQEVIERTLALGRPSRILVKVTSPALVEAGDHLFEGDRSVGVVTSASHWPNGHAHALALIKSAALDSSHWVTERGSFVSRDVG